MDTLSASDQLDPTLSSVLDIRAVLGDLKEGKKEAGPDHELLKMHVEAVIPWIESIRPAPAFVQVLSALLSEINTILGEVRHLLTATAISIVGSLDLLKKLTEDLLFLCQSETKGKGEGNAESQGKSRGRQQSAGLIR